MVQRTRIYLAAAGVAALIGGVWVSTRGAKQASVPAKTMPPSIEQLFAITLKTSTGADFAMQSLQGKPVLVNVWAPWCAPCVEELPELSAVAASKAASQVAFIGLGVDSADNIASFSQKYPVSFPLLVAGLAGTQLAKSLGNASGALPFTALIDASGQVLAQKTGRIKTDELLLWLAKLP